jgi:hypothetical protein
MSAREDVLARRLSTYYAAENLSLGQSPRRPLHSRHPKPHPSLINFHPQFVDLGTGRRHPRAADSELRSLLLPKGLKSAASPKDPVAHWYEAQLIHYGLPRTRDKNLAKVRLTQALTAGKLAVPADVKKTEADLKKEWASAVRKAAKGGGDDGRSGARGVGNPGAGGKMRVTVDVDVDLPHGSSPVSAPFEQSSKWQDKLETDTSLIIGKAQCLSSLDCVWPGRQARRSFWSSHEVHFCSATKE